MRRTAIGSLVFFLLLIGTVTALASIPGSDGIIYGCYTQQAVNGAHVLTVIDSTGTCPAGTTALNWNQTGPQGPQGVQGPAGPAGPTGATGPAGPAGFTNSATDQSTTSTSNFPQLSWNTIDTATITLQAQHNVLALAKFEVWDQNCCTTTAIDTPTRLVIDGVASPNDGSALFQNGPFNWTINLAAGQHTISVQVWRGSNANGNGYAGNRSLTLLDLGS